MERGVVRHFVAWSGAVSSDASPGAHLSRPGFTVTTILAEQILMGAGFHNPPRFHYMNYIGMHRCSEAMSNHDCGSTNRQFAKSLKPICFRPGIEGTGRFIQDDDRSTP